MQTRTELETELVSQLQVASNSSLFPSTRITTLIQNAYLEATDLFIWNDLVKAKCTSSYATYEYYDYPEDFRSDDIIMLDLDDVPYSRRNFEDYKAYKQENPTGTEKYFSSFGRQFFIWPVPTTNGDGNITVWGAIQASALSEATTETIFSGNKESCNMAVVSLAFATAMKRIDASLAEKERASALATLKRQNDLEKAKTQRNQRINKPMLNVQDFFSGRSGRDPYYRFSYVPGSF